MKPCKQFKLEEGRLRKFEEKDDDCVRWMWRVSTIVLIGAISPLQTALPPPTKHEMIMIIGLSRSSEQSIMASMMLDVR